MTIDPIGPLGQAIQRALREQWISDTLAGDIKVRLAKPFGGAGAAKAGGIGGGFAGSTSTAPTSGSGSGFGFGSGGGGGGSSSSGGGGFGFGGGGSSSSNKDKDTKDIAVAAQASKEQQKEEAEKCSRTFVLAHEVLSLALAEETAVKGLPETLGSITGSLVSDCIAYLTAHYPTVQFQFQATPDPSGSGGFGLLGGSGGGVGSGSNPNFGLGGGGSLDLHTIVQLSTTKDGTTRKGDAVSALMGVAQCLFAVTYKYQATETHTKELGTLLQLLYTERVKLISEVPETSPAVKASSLVIYMCTVSLCNALNSWSGRIDEKGAFGTNSLLGSASVGTNLLSWVGQCRTHLEKNAPQTRDHHHHHVNQVGGSTSMLGNSSATGITTALPSAAPAEQFISIVLWSIAIFFVARSETDKGLDIGLEALAGDKLEVPSGSTTATEYCGGKAPKYFRKYLPANDAAQASLRLIVPTWMFANIGYEMAYFTLDRMLPLVHHLSVLDLQSYTAFSHVHDPQLLSGGSGGNNGEGGNGGYYNSLGGQQQHQRLNRRNVGFQPFTVRVAYLMDLLSAVLPYLPTSAIDAPHPEEVLQYMSEQIAMDGGSISDGGSLGLAARTGSPTLQRQQTLSTFVWTNIVVHLRKVFETHKSQTQWEPYTYKLCTSYFNMLSALCQTEADARRVFRALDSHLDCSDLLWSSTISRCKEAVGLSSGNSSGFNVGGGLGGAGGGGGGWSNGTTSAPGEVSPEIHQVLQQLGFRVKQLSSGYYRKHQHYFTCSVLRLLGGIASKMPQHGAHALSVPKVLSPDDAFSLLCAPRTDQGVASSVFSYLATLVHSEASQQEMLQRLEESQVLTTTGASGGGGGPKAGGYMGQHSNNSKPNSGGNDLQDLRSQFQDECRIGRYSITIATLQLWYKLLRYPVGASFVNLTQWYLRFFAEEVAIGLQSRLYVNRRELWVIQALVNGVLSRSLDPVIWSGSAVPLTTIMASTRAPRDVLGEVIDTMSGFVRDIDTVLSNERIIAVRSALRLCTSAIHLATRPGAESVFTLTARTVNNEEFLAVLLSLVLCENTPIRQLTIGLANAIGGHTMGRVSAIFQTTGDGGRRIIAECRTLLDSTAPPAFVDAQFPPDLAELDDSDEYSTDELRRRLIHLLVSNGSRGVPSATSWLCGYPAAGSTASFTAAVPTANLVGGVHALHRDCCLEVVLRSVNDPVFCHDFPGVAALYVKLLYVLKANPATNTEGLRQLLRLRDAHEYSDCIYSLSRNTTPLELDRYGFILRTLALEIFDPVDLEFVELHLKKMFLQPTEDEASSSTAALRRMNMTATVLGSEPLFAGWLATALHLAPHLPHLTFPVNAGNSIMYGGEGASGSGGVNGSASVQYDLAELLRLFRLERPNAPTSEIADLLLPFDAANTTLLAHAKTVNYVEGWCQVINVVCGRVEDVSHETLFLLLTKTLQGIKQGSHLSQSAQRHVFSAVSGTAVSLLSALHHCVSVRDGRHQRLPDSEAQNILKLLTHALIQYGEASAELRHNIYSCFVVFLSFPEVNIDPMILLRCRDALFARLTVDAADGFDDRTSQIMALRTLQRFCSVGDVAESFISTTSSLSAGVGARLSSFVSSLLSSVDRAICTGLGGCTHQEASVAVFLPEAAFSLLSRLSMTQASALHQINTFSQLRAMECWAVMRGILVGKGPYSHHAGGGSSGGSHGGGGSSSAKEISKRVLVVLLRWINVLARHLKDHNDASMQLGAFVNTHLGLLVSVFEAPINLYTAGGGGGPSTGGLGLASSVNGGANVDGSRFITTQHLELQLQGLTLLHTMSCSPVISAHVGELVGPFSLHHLLQVLCHRETRNCRLFVSDSQHMRGGQTMGAASSSQAVLLAKSARLLLQFFMNVFVKRGSMEAALPGGVSSKVGSKKNSNSSNNTTSIAAASTGESAGGPDLLEQAATNGAKMLSLLTSVYEQLLGACDDASSEVREGFTTAAETCALLMEAEILALETNKAPAAHYRLKEVLDEGTREMLLRAMDSHNACLERRNAAHPHTAQPSSSHNNNNDDDGQSNSPDEGRQDDLQTPQPTLTAPGAHNTGVQADWLRAGGGRKGVVGANNGGGGGVEGAVSVGAPQANTAVFVHLRRLLRTK